MTDRQIDQSIAGALLYGRALRLPTLRAMAECSLGSLKDRYWTSVEANWKWHDQKTTEELHLSLFATRQ